jgi:hypothetical protein
VKEVRFSKTRTHVEEVAIVDEVGVHIFNPPTKELVSYYLTRLNATHMYETPKWDEADLEKLREYAKRGK